MAEVASREGLSPTGPIPGIYHPWRYPLNGVSESVEAEADTLTASPPPQQSFTGLDWRQQMLRIEQAHSAAITARSDQLAGREENRADGR